MRCMVFVKATNDSENGVIPSAELLAAMGNYNEELLKAGIMLGGGGLRPTSQAKRVRFSSDKRHRRTLCVDTGTDCRLLALGGQVHR
jgi:hypothetical protein